MTELELDTAAARATLQATIRETDEQRGRHLAHPPAYPVAAAGADFAARGTAIAEMFAQVHDAGARRVEALLTATNAAARQVEIFSGTETDFADTLEPGR